MPYNILKNKIGGYKVINKDTKAIKAYNTTLPKAEKQVRYLEMINHKDDGNMVGRKKFFSI